MMLHCLMKSGCQEKGNVPKLFLEDLEHHVTGVTLPIYLMLVA